MLPLISCLIVTLPVPERVAGFKLSVDDFLRQSHPKKELIIVMNGGDAATRRMISAYVGQLQRPEVRLVEVPGLWTLGALRRMLVWLRDAVLISADGTTMTDTTRNDWRLSSRV